MNSAVITDLSVAFLGVAALLLTYYSTAFNTLNSAQIEKLTKSSSQNGDQILKGLRLPIFKLGLQISALFLEIAFLVGLTWIFIQKSSGIKSIILVGLIAICLELFSRIFIPLSFPLRERSHLTNLELLMLSTGAYIFFPASYLMEMLSRNTLKALYPKTDSERISDAEATIKSIIDMGEKEGIFKEDDGEMLQSIVEFSETIVREVMTPRIDLQSLEIDQSLEDFTELVIQTGYSKIPVYRNRIDNIVGILYAKDILKFWNAGNKKIEIQDIVRPPYFIPETKKVRDLLREFQKEKIHMAVVVDEYGGVAGIVTIEDLLEEIVGEIHDEYDIELKIIDPLGDNSWLVDARIDLDELEEILDVEFPRDNYETLGGFLFHQLGHVPAVGEIHQFNNLDIEIKEANDRQILRVVIQRKCLETPTKQEDSSNHG